MMRTTDARVLGVLLGVFVVLLTYDGAVRKWLLPGYEQLVFLAKDVVLVSACVYALLAGSNRHSRSQIPVHVGFLLFVYGVWVFLEVFNPYLPSLLLGIWGLKAHLLYAGLILVVPAVMSDLGRLLGTLERYYPWLVIPVCCIGLAQVAAPADSFLNQQVRGEFDGLAIFGDTGLVRVSGPFSYLSGMGSFINFAFLLGVGLYLSGRRSLPFLAGLATVFLSLPVTGSRGVIVGSVTGTIALFAAAFVVGPKQRWATVHGAIILAALLSISLYLQPDTWLALQQRAENSATDHLRIVAVFSSALDYFDIAGPFGFGAGATSIGARALVPDLELFSWIPVGFEEESGRMVLELGVVGWIFSLAMRAAILVWSLVLLTRGCNANVRTAAMLGLPHVIVGLYAGTGVVGSAYNAPTYWFFVSILAVAQYEQARTTINRLPASLSGRRMKDQTAR